MPRWFTLGFVVLANGLLTFPVLAKEIIGLGYVLPREAALWVELEATASVEVLLRREGETEATPAIFPARPAVARSGSAYRKTVTLGPLQPRQGYQYEVRIDGQRRGDPGRFRTPADPGDATIEPYHILLAARVEPMRASADPQLDALAALAGAGGDAVIWLGGQHAAAPASPTADGLAHHFRALLTEPALASIRSSTAQWSVWSASDIPASAQGPLALHGTLSRRAFCEAWPRPVCGHPVFGGTVSQARLGPAGFFFLDAVSFREPGGNGRPPRLLGEAQMEWLLHALDASDAPFRFIVAGLPLLPRTRGAENWRATVAEQTDFFNRLLLRNPPGVFILSGNAPFGELSRLERTARYPLHELTLGPVRQQDSIRQPPLNMDRQPGTFTADAHFAKLTLARSPDDWSLTVEVFDGANRLLWRDQFLASELVRAP